MKKTIASRFWTVFDGRPIPFTAQLQWLQNDKRNFCCFLRWYLLERSLYATIFYLFLWIGRFSRNERAWKKKTYVNWVWAHWIMQFERRHHSTASTSRTKCSVRIKCDVMNLHKRININIMPCCSQNKKMISALKGLLNAHSHSRPNCRLQTVTEKCARYMDTMNDVDTERERQRDRDTQIQSFHSKW